MGGCRAYLLLLFCFLYSTWAGVAQGQVVANFVADRQQGCAPLIVHFTNTSSGAVSYSWDLGNLSTSVLHNPAASYLTPGSYTVKLTAKATNGSTSIKTLVITVYSVPQVNFSAPASVCTGASVSFTDQTVVGLPGPVIYRWNFGDGSTSALQHPIHTYTVAGYYNVSLRVTNSQGCDSLLLRTSFIHILPLPAITFSVSNPHLCVAPAAALFASRTVGNGPYTYAWNFGDHDTSSTNNPPHTYQNYGTYTVSLAVSDKYGCRDTDVQTAFVQVGPGPSISATVGCPGVPVTFTGTPSAATITWAFGDDSLGTGVVTKHTYDTAGSYNVQMIAIDGTCKDTLILPVVIHPTPVDSFKFTVPCTVPAATQFTGIAPPGSTYAWSFSDSTSSTLANPVHTFKAYGRDSIALSVTSQYGCKNTDTQKVKIYDLYPLIKATDTSGCTPLSTIFMVHDSTTIDSPHIYPYAISKYLWNFADGSPLSVLASPHHIYTTGGLYNAYVIVTTSNGCVATDTILIATAPVPQVTFTAQPTHVCAGEPVIFRATQINGAHYNWNFASAVITNKFPDNFLDTVEYTYPGTFSPVLVVTDNGCSSALIAPNISIKVDSPGGGFDVGFYCDTPTKISFGNYILGSDNFTWNFGDGTSSNLKYPPDHYYSSLGYYTPELVTYNAASGCRVVWVATVQLHDTYTSFSSNDTAICAGGIVTTTATLTDGGDYNFYTWYVDGVQKILPDSVTVITDTFNAKGWHSLELIEVDDHGCFDTVLRNNYILVGHPADSFTFNPAQGCGPLTVQFTDRSTDVAGAYIVSHSWSYSDGTSSLNLPGTTTAHSYRLGAGYYPTETIIDNIGCIDSFTSRLPVNVFRPIASFTASTLLPCRFQPDSFINNSTNAISNYWNFGDSTYSAAVAPTHTYTHNSAYTVSLTVTDKHGCKDSVVHSALLNIGKPKAAFSLSDSASICSPIVENFTNASVNAASYQWLFGNNTFSSLTNPSIQYAAPGIYAVYLVATDTNGCNDTTSKILRVYGYTNEITYTPVTGCTPLTVNFTANITNVPNITWDFSDGTVSATTSSVTASHTYKTPGAYVPKIIISDSTGCAASSVGPDTIKADMVIAGFTSFPFPLCVYDTLKFQDTSKSYFSSIAGHTWTINNSTTSYLTSPFYYALSDGDFPVMLVVINSSGCRDTVTGYVTVHPLPVITAGSDTIICAHDFATLVASGGVTYSWSPAASVDCPTCSTTHASPTGKTTYIVTGKDALGCVNIDSTHLALKTKTTDWPGKGGEICDKQSIMLSDSGAQTYIWYPATALSSDTVSDPLASPSGSTVYMVVARQGSCSPDTSYVGVVVHPLPVVKATAGEATIIAGASADLLVSGASIVSFLWAPAALLDCDSCSRVLAKLIETTTFTVTGATQYGCKDSAHVTVDVLCDKSQVFIPNTFTPNNDGQNDVFYPRGVGLKVVNSFRIYNRWGELIFERDGIQLNDPGSGWDGTIKGGKPLPDVYVYVVDGVCDNNSPISWKGDVTLVR